MDNKKTIEEKIAALDAGNPDLEGFPIPAHAHASEEENDDDVEGEDVPEAKVSEDVSKELENLEKRRMIRLARKPDVSRLERAVVDGVPQFDKGTRVVVERRISFVDGHPWLDTCLYTVQHVDLATGVVQALDEEHGHRSFLSFKDKHHDWYLCPKKGNPLAKSRKKRRSRGVSEE